MVLIRDVVNRTNVPPFSRGSRALLALLAGVLLVFGCSSSPAPAPSDGKALTGTDEQIFLDDSLEQNYNPHVIMKRAEAFFEKEAYPEAIVEYQHFLDMNRTHVLAPYAQYRLAESHFKMAKSVDRDPEPIINARAMYEKLLKSYPGSKYEIDTLMRIRECQNWIAETHLFVGRFYLRRGSFLAAAHRFESILKEETELDVMPDALYYLALTYKELGAGDWAKDQLIALSRRYPDHKYQGESQVLFAELGVTPPASELAKAVTIAPEAVGLTTEASPNGSNALGTYPSALTQSNGTAMSTIGLRPSTNGAGASATASGRKPVSASTGTNGSNPTRNGSSSVPNGSGPTPQPRVTHCRLGTWC